MTLAEAEFGQDEETEEDGEEENDNETEFIPGINRILLTDDQHQLTDDEAYITYLQPLLRLAELKIGSSCTVHECWELVDKKLERVGSALYIKLVNYCLINDNINIAV